MKILAIGAHPDDIEYGCGGLLLKAVAAGHEVFLNVMTTGGINPDIDRRKEQENAAGFLGAKKLIWGGFQDTALSPNRELIVAVEKAIDAVSPGLVLVNYPDDAHQDHIALARCTTTACRYVKRVLFYHDYTTLDFTPDTFADITEVLEKKKLLLALHKSQVSKNYPTGLDMLENVSARASYYGFMAKVKYAEGFKPLRNLIDF
ncbi:MAG: PIG-L deacetylase family protein [Kiritimatiellia bacterium]